MQTHPQQDTIESMLAKMAPQFVAYANEQMAADGASVTIVDGDAIEYVEASGLAEGIKGRRNLIADSFTGTVILCKRAALFKPGGMAASTERAKKDGIRSGIIAPVVLDGRVVGTIGVVSRTADAFKSRDVRKMQEIAEFVCKTMVRALGKP